MQFPKLLYIVLSTLTALPSLAQDLTSGTYQHLSAQYYSKQKDSLKRSWTCPPYFKERETQKKYKEIWTARTDFLVTALENNHYLYDKITFDYVDGIIQQITRANKDRFPVPPFLLIDRSASANAYALGGDIIAVNLGLIAFAQTREELALAIAHELSHNILNHAENAMKQRAELLTSEEYKNSLNAVLDSKYERLTRLKKILVNYSFSRSKHQRYHESEADSLAISLLKKANIPFQAGFFQRMDSSDLHYQQPLKKSVKEYFSAYTPAIEENWIQRRTRGLSTRTYSFRDTTLLADSLRTHPDCEERYKRTLHLSDRSSRLTTIPPVIHQRANEMMLWNLFDNMSLTPCLYRILLEKDKGNDSPWLDFMLHNIFAGLYYSDRELRRFNAIGIVPKEWVSKEYNQLQTFLEQIPRESLEKFCRSIQAAPFWSHLSASDKSLKVVLDILAFDADASEKRRAAAAKVFAAENSNSIYREFTTRFETK